MRECEKTVLGVKKQDVGVKKYGFFHSFFVCSNISS